MWNYQPFFMIADHLARQGFATLRMDDRGTGKSGGSYAGTTLQSAAADAECALDYLRRRPETDPGRTGLIGHSMGGTIAFRIAARRPQDVACVVALAGATQKGKDWMMEQCEKSVLQLLPAATGDSLRRSYAGLYDALSHSLPLDSARERCLPYMLDIWQRLDIFPEQLREDLPESRRMDNARFLLRATITPEFASLVQYDPTDDLKRTSCPVWAAYGEKRHAGDSRTQPAGHRGAHERQPARHHTRLPRAEPPVPAGPHRPSDGISGTERQLQPAGVAGHG